MKISKRQSSASEIFPCRPSASHSGIDRPRQRWRAADTVLVGPRQVLVAQTIPAIWAAENRVWLDFWAHFWPYRSRFCRSQTLKGLSQTEADMVLFFGAKNDPCAIIEARIPPNPLLPLDLPWSDHKQPGHGSERARRLARWLSAASAPRIAPARLRVGYMAFDRLPWSTHFS